jgi:hypothetical protein
MYQTSTQNGKTQNHNSTLVFRLALITIIMVLLDDSVVSTSRRTE